MTKWGKEVKPENAWKEYPRPQMARNDWLNLNGLWDYAVTTQGAEAPAKWDGQILVPFPIESALSGVGKHLTSKQTLWYRRTFEVPAGWKDRRVLLHFEAVDWEAEVGVNGQFVGGHTGGSDPFSFDITDALKEGKNELQVRVWDPTDAAAQPRGKQVSKPGGIWYTPVSGIWQTVWLEPVAEGALARVVPVPDLDTGTVRFDLEYHGRKPDAVSVTISDVDGPFMTLIDRRAEGPLLVRRNVWRLWTPDEPQLYTVTVQTLRGPQVVDEVSSYFAMRKISTGK